MNTLNEEPNVEFDEKDMEDPNLLNELDDILTDKPVPIRTVRATPNVKMSPPESPRDDEDDMEDVAPVKKSVPKKNIQNPVRPPQQVRTQQLPRPPPAQKVSAAPKSIPIEHYDSISIDRMPEQQPRRPAPVVTPPPVIVPLEIQVQSDEEQRKLTIQTLIAVLEKQAAQANNAAVKARDSGDKDKAAIFLKRKKAWVSDIEKIREIQANKIFPLLSIILKMLRLELKY